MNEFEPKILAYCCNRCASVFFFGAPAMRASPPKEKRLGKKNTLDLRSSSREIAAQFLEWGLALNPGRSLASLGTRGLTHD